MIDTHAHLYLDQFDDDIEVVIERAKKAGVKKVLLPNVDLDTIHRMMRLVEKDPSFFVPMMGIHPTSINESCAEDLEKSLQWFQNAKYCAVGEIGIDLYWDKTHQKQQEDAFRTQLNWALEKDLPVVIHARDSFQEIFEVLKEFKGKALRGVFHSFTGGLEEILEIKAFGKFFFGINGIVTFKNSHLSSVLSEIGLESLLLETDAPYLAPTPYRGKRNESAYLGLIANKIALALGVSKEDIVERTSENAEKLFQLSNF